MHCIRVFYMNIIHFFSAPLQNAHQQSKSPSHVFAQDGDFVYFGHVSIGRSSITLDRLPVIFS